MISETSFSQHHTSTWRSIAPATDLFIRKVNTRLYERAYAPMKTDVEPFRRAFLNAIAFNLYSGSVAPDSAQANVEGEMARAVLTARQSLARFKGQRQDQLLWPNETETEDCIEQVRRLRGFFSSVSRGHAIQILPRFPGCGILDTCYGDVYFDETLFEVKAGDRSFRSSDLRQLLTYAALNKVANAMPLHQIGLFNPRTGTFLRTNIDFLSAEISGRTSNELLDEIIRVISSGDISR